MKLPPEPLLTLCVPAGGRWAEVVVMHHCSTETGHGCTVSFCKTPRAVRHLEVSWVSVNWSRLSTLFLCCPRPKRSPSTTPKSSSR